MLSTFQFPDIPKEIRLDDPNTTGNLLSSASSLSSLNSLNELTQDLSAMGPISHDATTTAAAVPLVGAQTTKPPQVQAVPQRTQPVSVAPESTTQNANITNESSSNEAPTSNLFSYSLTVDPLVQTDIAYATASSSEVSASARLLDTVVLHNMIDRLHGSLNTFYDSLVLKSRMEPQKFTHAYHQAQDLYNSILKGASRDDHHHQHQTSTTSSTTTFMHAYQRGSPFFLTLRPSHRDMINSFLGIVRDPCFISSVLFTLSSQDIDHIILGNSPEPFEDLAALNRTKPLDILFHSMFPPNAPISQKINYFSQICATLIEHKRFEQLSFALFDKFMEQSGYPSASALEDILLTLLQEGTFLCMINCEGNSSSPHRTPEPASHQSSFGSNTTTNSGSSNGSNTPVMKHVTTVYDMRHLKPSAKSSSISLSSSLDETVEKRVSEFLQKSINMLLNYFDNNSVESIPKTFMTFVQSILEKVSSENRDEALLFIVVKYIFNRYLHKLLTSPEQLGILKDYYIDEDQRQKILGAVFDKMYKLIVSAAYYYDQSDEQVGIDKVKHHLDAIMSRLSGNGNSSDNSNNQGYSLKQPHDKENTNLSDSLIVLSPSDVVFLFQAFFPSSRRPQLSTSVVTPSPVTSSSPRTIETVMERRNSTNYTLTSGFSPGSSQPKFSGIGYSPSPLESCVATSYVSTSTVHIDHPRDDIAGLSGSGPEEFLQTDDRFNFSTPVFGPTEDVGYDLDCIKRDVEPAISELINRFPYLKFKDKSHYLYSLRPNKISQFRVPHPFIEKWQVFRINASTNNVTDVYETNILDSVLFDSLDSINITSSDMDSSSNSSLPATNRQLFEIIQKAVEKVVSEISSSPYASSVSQGYIQETTPSPRYLYTLLNDALAKSVAKGQFLDSNDYSKALQCLESLMPAKDETNPSAMLIYDQTQYYVNNCVISSLANEKERALKRTEEKLMRSNKQMVPYKIHIDSALKRCEATMAKLNDYKVKMWYRMEIRTSALWTRARDVAMMLTYPYTSLSKEASQVFGSGNPVSVYNSLLRRNNSGSSISSAGTASHNGASIGRNNTLDKQTTRNPESKTGGFSFRRFASFSSRRDMHQRRQSVINVQPTSNGMFAPKELGGELKLSDKESENTMKWLNGQQIQNFCSGEERIHRFCCEVDDLVKRVMGDTLTSRRNKGHSLLSSSPLFRNDLWKLILEVDGAYRTSTPNMTYQTARSTGYGGINNNHNKRSSMFVQSSTLFGSTEMETETSPRRKSTEGAFSRRRGNSTSNVTDGSLAAAESLRLPKEFQENLAFENTNWGSSGIADSGASISVMDHHGHRRNKSLSEVSEVFEIPADQSFVQEEEDDVLTPELNAKREHIEEMISNIQMRLISFIYTDIGVYCWYEGSETDKWLNLPIVRRSMEIRERLHNKLSSAISEMPPLMLNDPPSGRMEYIKHNRDTLGSSSATDDASSICTVPGTTLVSQPGASVTATGLTGNTVTSSPVNSLQNPGHSNPVPGSDVVEPALESSPSMSFHFDDAYRRILQRFSVTTSPMGKLNALHELELLVVSSLSSTITTTNAVAGTPGSVSSISNRHRASKTSLGSDLFAASHRSCGSLSEVRNKGAAGLSSLTELFPIITSTSTDAKRTSSAAGTAYSNHQRVLGPNTDMIAEELRRVLKSSDIKSHTLFRDLQFIASFVPPQVLDLTDMGKAFWDVSLAALSLKSEALSAIVNSASEIFQYNTGMITNLDSEELEFVSSYGLNDCALLWKIGVKEGDAVSQRELAIMLMSHPEIASVHLPPFTLISQVFEPNILEDPRATGDLDKYDPVRMAVVKHLMANAAFYDDEIATEYLQQSVYKEASVI